MKIINIFFTLSSHDQIFLVLSIIIFISLFFSIIVFPLIFRFNIIPLIEKRLNKKLEYKMWFYYISFFGKFFWAPVDISSYIIWLHIHSLFKRQPKMSIRPAAALQIAGYDIERAQINELVWSYLYFLNLIIGFSILLIVNYLEQ